MKLSNATRDTLINTIIDGKFKALKEKNAVKKKILCGRMYNKLYSKKERELMAQLPKSYFKYKTCLRIQFRGKTKELHLDTRLPFGNCHISNYNPYITIEPKTSIGDAYEILETDIRKLKEEEGELITKARQVIYAANTDKQLLEAWPEIEEYVKPFQRNIVKSLVPVGMVKELNEKLELVKNN